MARGEPTRRTGTARSGTSRTDGRTTRRDLLLAAPAALVVLRVALAGAGLWRFVTRLAVRLARFR